MLISRLHRSIDLVLEGIDNCNVGLILEASQEFAEGYKKLGDQIKEFIKVCDTADFGNQLDVIKAPMKKYLEQLDKIDLKKIPDKFSFKASADLHGSSEDKNPNFASVTQILAGFDTYYNGTKDVIIEIAKMLEGFDEVFAVGKDGIVLTPPFAKVDNIEDKLVLRQFTYSTPVELATFFATGNDGESDEWKEVYREELKAIAEKLGDPEEKAEEAEQAFLDQFEQIKNAIKPMADKASKSIYGREPEPSILDAVKEEGFLQSLFKSANPGKLDTKEAQEIVEVLLGLPITNLFKLTQGLIAMTKNFEDTSQAAVDGTTAQAEKITEVPPAAAEFKKKLNAFIKTDKRKADVLAVAFEMLGEKHGVKKGESFDYTKIPSDEVEDLLTDHDFDDEQIKKFLVEFGYEKGEEEDETEERKTPRETVEELVTDEEAREAFLDLAQGEGMILDDGSANPENTDEQIEQILSAAEFTIADEKEEEIKNAFKVQEEGIFHRWGQLAGIIKE